jgi:hypothetical protein
VERGERERERKRENGREREMLVKDTIRNVKGIISSRKLRLSWFITINHQSAV